MKLFNQGVFCCIVLLGIFLTACGDEDPATADCTDQDIIGIWDGPIMCDSSTVNQVTIEFFDDAGVLSTRYLGNEFPATRIGCTLESMGDFGSYGYDIDCSLSGDRMSMDLEDWSPFGPDKCTATLTKR